MKKTLYVLAPAMLLCSTLAIAQDKEKKEAEKKVEKKEIIIQEKASGKTEKMTIMIDGDNVTINGQPAENYKGNKHIVIDDDIVINGDMVRVPRDRGQRVYVKTTNSNKALLGVVTDEDAKGAKVKEVVKESAAEKAGLKEGDIITAINANKVAGHADLVNAIGKMKPNDVADVTFLRDGKEKKVKATLAKSKSNYAYSYGSDRDFNFDYDFSPPMALAGTHPKLFMNDHDMWVFRSDRPKYGMSLEDYADADGVNITGIDSASNAEKAGLKVGDIITGVDGNAVKNVDALREALLDSKDKASITLNVLRNGKTEAINVRVPKLIKKADL